MVLFLFFQPCCLACGILFPRPGMELRSLRWKLRELTTVLPGKGDPTPRGSAVKKPPVMQETWVWSLGDWIPWRRAWQSTPVFLPRESCELRNCINHAYIMTLSWKTLKWWNSESFWIGEHVLVLGEWHFSTPWWQAPALRTLQTSTCTSLSGCSLVSFIIDCNSKHSISLSSLTCSTKLSDLSEPLVL